MIHQEEDFVRSPWTRERAKLNGEIAAPAEAANRGDVHPAGLESTL